MRGYHLFVLGLCIALLSSVGAEVSPGVATVLGKTPDLSGRDRLRAVSRLGIGLREEDRTALLAYLAEHKKAPSPFSERQWYAFVNDVMDVLGRQRPLETRLPGLLRELFGEGEERPFVVRDYALQHLGNWVLQDDDDSESVKTLKGAAAEVDQTYGATALLALQRVSRKFPERVPVAEVAALAEKLAQGDEVPDASKATALQVLATSGDVRAAVAVARPLALEPKTTLMLRLSAISVLGKAGDEELLRELARAEQTNEFVRKASERALTQINQEVQ